MIKYFYLFISIVLFYSNDLYAAQAQDDTVFIPEAPVSPEIDGRGNDPCWQNIPWQSIDNVWIPVGDSINPEDFSGHYKAVWSSSENLLYFLIEVFDDVFVDGFMLGQTADVYNFDIAEVFIDEDISGGLHVFDGSGNIGNEWGTNAENAFTYHIYADFPDDEEINNNCYVQDLDGTGWSNVITRNYTSHIPEFALWNPGDTAVWEFSLIVYDDTYEITNPDTALSRVVLTEGKVIGLSVAYCDNDNPGENPKVRDNMYGTDTTSTENIHWIDADYFGRMKLTEELEQTDAAEEKQAQVMSRIAVYPNPSASMLNVELRDAFTGNVVIKLYNILGEEVVRTYAPKTSQVFNHRINLNHLSPGYYILHMQMGNRFISEKVIVRGGTGE